MSGETRHDLSCALRPGDCRHDVEAIAYCVICGGALKGSPHLDTCSERCFHALLERQRRNRERGVR